MSGLQDARVLSAFTQGIQRAYMLGVEQRLTSALNATGTLSSAGRLNHAFTTSASSFSTSSSTAVDVTGMSVTLSTTGGTLLVLASAQMFYCNASAAGTGEFGFSVDGGATEWVWLHDVAAAENDVYGLAAIRAFTVAAGSHTVKGRARSAGGSLNIQAGSDWPLFMMAVEL